MPENFLEGLSLMGIRRLFHGFGLFGEAARDLVASPGSSEVV